MRSKSTLLLICLVGLALTSCGTYRMYVNDEADFGYYQRVGVIPFSNLSSDRNASEKVTAAMVTELLIGGKVEVANMGDIAKAFKTVIKDDRYNLPEQLTAEEAQALGKEGNLQGIFVGAVRDYSMTRSGQDEFPLVSIAIRLFDCQSGRVVWSYEITEKGGPKFPIFSFGETHTLGELTSKVCGKVAKAFTETLK